MEENNEKYIIQDDLGRWKNSEFPPDSYSKFPNNTGYSNSNKEMLFYQFSVMHYDLKIVYKGVKYLAIIDSKAYVADSDYNPVSPCYTNGNDLIRAFKFPDGNTLLDVLRTRTTIDIDIL